MTRYMLSVHSAQSEVREPMSAEEMQHSWQQIGILEAEMKSTGAWVFSGRLHEPDTSTVVRLANGEILTTDGPYAEAKEHLGGFYIINCRGPRRRACPGREGHPSHRGTDRGAPVRRFRR